MAGGKQTPRQKMINLMYLVFIAMMALQMSREVLTAFGMVNESLAETSERTSERNEALMAGLAQKVEEQPEKYRPLKAKADTIHELSVELYTYLENLKNELYAGMDDPSNYEEMDKSSQLDEYFFQSGKPGNNGKEFVAAIDKYRQGVSALYPQLADEIDRKFNTDPVKDNEGVTKDWLTYNFMSFPVVASITKFTAMQSDIAATESEILSRMLSGQLESEVSLTNYQAIVIPDKTAFFSGENFQGKVVLGRFDNTLQFENVIINGREVEGNTVGGQVVLNFPAGNVGEQEITGELQYIENDSLKSIPIQSSYAVIPKPNAAVISADKMNVVYRGVDNPMTISIPGVGNVSAKAPGLRHVGGANYVMNVTTLQSRDVTITASGQLPGGESVSDTKTFRIKDIPSPVATVRGESGNIRMPRENLAISTIGAVLPDFDFDLDLRVTGFKVKIPGAPTIQVRGTQFDAAAKNALQRAGRGEAINIFDIEAQIVGNSSYRLKRISPVVVELTN